MLSQMEQSFLLLMILFIMFGVGCSLDKEHFRETLKVKKAWGIGMFCQFLLMPILGSIIVRILDLPVPMAIGLLVLACSPGGSTSNLFTYFSKGHTALSITMTIASTIASFLLMPLVLWITLSSLSSSSIVIPFKNIFISLFLVICPVALGYLLKSKNGKAAKIAEKLSGVCGLVVVFIMIVIWIPKFYGGINEDNIKMYTSIALLNIGGMSFGYLISSLFSLAEEFKRPIMFETGIQNAPLAFVLINLSFTDGPIKEIGQVPLNYGALSIGTGIVFTLLIRFLGKATKNS